MLAVALCAGSHGFLCPVSSHLSNPGLELDALRSPFFVGFFCT